MAAAATATATAVIAITGEGRAATDRGPVAPASDDLKILRDDYDDDDGGGGGCGVRLAAAATATATAVIAITGKGRAATDRGPVAPASDDLKILRDDYDDDDGGGGGCGVRLPPSKGGGSRSRCTK